MSERLSDNPTAATPSASKKRRKPRKEKGSAIGQPNETIRRLQREVREQNEQTQALAKSRWTADEREDAASIICDRIAVGIGGVAGAIREMSDEGLAAPSAKLFYMWTSRYEPIAEMYSLAKRQQAQNVVDKLTQLTEAAEKAEKNDVPGLRLASDNLKWLAERLAPEWSTKIIATDTQGKEVQPVFNVLMVQPDAMPEIEKPPALEAEYSEAVDED